MIHEISKDLYKNFRKHFLKNSMDATYMYEGKWDHKLYVQVSSTDPVSSGKWSQTATCRPHGLF